MYFFTADEHYGHSNIIKYCNRPFRDVSEMDETIINNHNSVVGSSDIVIHAGDFCWCNTVKDAHKQYISKLNGNHIFLRGSHDKWMNYTFNDMFTKTIEGAHIVVCHYAMRVWPRSHYNSWQLFGHSHGKLTPVGKQMDIGVDTNNFYPYSFDQIAEIMHGKPDNSNYIFLREMKVRFS